MHTLQRFRWLMAALLAVSSLAGADEEAAKSTRTTAPSESSDRLRDELLELKSLILSQQQQIDALRRRLESQESTQARNAAAPAGSNPFQNGPEFVRASTNAAVGAVAFMPAVLTSATPAVETAALPVPEQAATQTAAKVLEIPPFGVPLRFSGDIRFREDTITRSGNSVAGPQQNLRARYRVRLNVDRDVFERKDKDHPDALPLFRLHAQLATGPLNNPLTLDSDFAGSSVHPIISLSEAWIEMNPLKGLNVRLGRQPEAFLDGTRFTWDDDIRLTGASETYTVHLPGKATIDFKAAQYILTNPNVQIVPAGSPFLDAGYRVGQRVPAAKLFHEGLIIKVPTSTGWIHTLTGDLHAYTNVNQIQLLSTANGFAALGNGAVGVALSGAVAQPGNATTTAGGSILNASNYKVAHGGYAATYKGWERKQSWPVTFDVQYSENLRGNTWANAFFVGVKTGSVKKPLDMMLGYNYFRKGANSIISQYTDDDLGTGPGGVNLAGHYIRWDVGIARFSRNDKSPIAVEWQNHLFIVDPLAKNDPANKFFVPLQSGANTIVRLQSQILFRF